MVLGVSVSSPRSSALAGVELVPTGAGFGLRQGLGTAGRQSLLQLGAGLRAHRPEP